MSVRLACVRHAASVHPEPGSNSHVEKFFLARIIWLSIFVCFANISGFYCFVWVDSFESNLFSEILIWNFQGCITVYLSMCFVLRCSAATLISYHVLRTLSTSFLNFFQKLFELSFRLLNTAKTCVLRGGFLIYHIQAIFVNIFLNYFLFGFLQNKSAELSTYKFLSVEKTEKEGFEPSRRVSDLHP